MAEQSPVTLDLGVDDVHTPATAGPPPKVKQMAEISTATRKSLPDSDFALPSLRKYPIENPAHVRNAAARLEQNKDSLTAAQYAEAKRNIAARAKKFGIKSQYNAKSMRNRRGLRMRISPDGSMDVSHMMKDGGICMPGLVELKSSDGPVWIQIAKTGTFNGYRGGGFALTSKVFDNIIRNFNATENKKIPIDFEHATEASGSDGNIAQVGAPAQGWITSLDNRGSELWGQVEWCSDLAKKYIKDGSYKFLSPAIRFNQKDPVTGQPIGERLTSAALTNIPFLDGMQAVAARDLDEQPLTAEEEAGSFVRLSWLNDYGSSYSLPGVRKALKLDEFASSGDIMSRCARLREMYADDSQSAGVDMNSVTSGLREFTGVPLHSDVGEALDAIEAFIDQLEGEYGTEQCCPVCNCECVDCPNCGVECCPCCGHDCPGSQPPTVATAADVASAGEIVTMEPKTILLSEHESTVAELKQVRLELKDATAKTTEADAKVVELTAEIATLKNTLAARDTAEADRTKKERASRVDAAFLSYKDTRKLTDDDKEAMALLLDSGKEELFNRLYPPIPANLAALTQRITSPREAPVVRQVPAGSKGNDIKTLADKHMKDGKSYDEAYTLAINEASGTTAL